MGRSMDKVTTEEAERYRKSLADGIEEHIRARAKAEREALRLARLGLEYTARKSWRDVDIHNERIASARARLVEFYL